MQNHFYDFGLMTVLNVSMATVFIKHRREFLKAPSVICLCRKSDLFMLTLNRIYSSRRRKILLWLVESDQRLWFVNIQLVSKLRRTVRAGREIILILYFEDKVK